MFIKIFVDTVKYGYGYNIFKGYLGVHTNNNLKILLSLPPEVMYEIACQCFDNNPNCYKIFSR